MFLRRALTVLIGSLLLAGCLPIELDVGKDGRVLIPRQEGFFTFDPATGKLARVYKPDGAQPVFARFLPDGKSIVAVSERTSGGGGPMGFGGGGQTMELVTLADGSSKVLDTVQNVTYLTISPDGKSAAYTCLSDKQTSLGGDQKENLPELRVLDLATGKSAAVKDSGAVAAIHRWFPDSKSVLVFQIKEKIKEGNLYKGILTKVDVATGRATPLAAALGSSNVFLDLSPDGGKVLFNAAAAGVADAQLPPVAPGAGQTESLFELDVATATVRKVRDSVKYALWSAKGTKVLAVGTNEDNKVVLEVADAAMKEFVPVAQDVCTQAGDSGSTVSVYASWIGDDQIAYLGQRAVYGKVGKNLELIVVGADGKNPQPMQVAIDEQALKAK